MALKARIENGIVYSPYPSFVIPDISMYQVIKERLTKYGTKTALVNNVSSFIWPAVYLAQISRRMNEERVSVLTSLRIALDFISTHCTYTTNQISQVFTFMQICGEEEMTHEGMLKMFQKYTAGFQAHGIQQGDKVLLHLDNSLENLAAIYGVVFAGGIVILSETAASQGKSYMS